MISYIQSSFFYYHYYYFGHTTYHQKLCHLKKPRKMTIRPHVPVEIIRVFLISDFQQKFSKPEKASKKYHLIYNIVSLKKFHSFYKTQLARHCKQPNKRNTAKNLSHFKSFPGNMFLVGIRKNICTVPISRRQRTAFLKHFESKCLCIFVYLRKKIFVSETQEAFIWWTWGGGMEETEQLHLGGSMFWLRKIFYKFSF